MSKSISEQQQEEAAEQARKAEAERVAYQNAGGAKQQASQNANG